MCPTVQRCLKLGDPMLLIQFARAPSLLASDEAVRVEIDGDWIYLPTDDHYSNLAFALRKMRTRPHKCLL
jgi:hypothetical protein